MGRPIREQLPSFNHGKASARPARCASSIAWRGPRSPTAVPRRSRRRRRRATLIARPGSYPLGRRAPYGTRDQAGNVAEWTARCGLWRRPRASRLNEHTARSVSHELGRRSTRVATVPFHLNRAVVRGGSASASISASRTNVRDPFNMLLHCSPTRSASRTSDFAALGRSEPHDLNASTSSRVSASRPESCTASWMPPPVVSWQVRSSPCCRRGYCRNRRRSGIDRLCLACRRSRSSGRAHHSANNRRFTTRPPRAVWTSIRTSTSVTSYSRFPFGGRHGHGVADLFADHRAGADGRADRDPAALDVGLVLADDRVSGLVAGARSLPWSRWPRI